MFKMNKLITPVKVEINFMHKTKYFSENISSALEIPLAKSPLHFAIRFMSPAKKRIVLGLILVIVRLSIAPTFVSTDSTAVVGASDAHDIWGVSHINKMYGAFLDWNL